MHITTISHPLQIRSNVFKKIFVHVPMLIILASYCGATFPNGHCVYSYTLENLVDNPCDYTEINVETYGTWGFSVSLVRRDPGGKLGCFMYCTPGHNLILIISFAICLFIV